MKIEVKVDAACEETTVVICTDKVTDEIQQLVRKLSQDAPQVIVGFLEDEAVILSQEEIVRVFAEGGKVFAETSGGQFQLRLRLYELEERLDGKHFVRISNAEIINLGISMSFVPEDRLGMGLVAQMGMTGNMMLKNYSKARGLFVDRKPAKQMAQSLIRKFNISSHGNSACYS